MIRKFFIVQLLMLATVVTAAAQDIRPRIAGLENNERYMALLRDDAQMQQREDSLVTAVNRMRDAYRKNPSGSISTDEILALESGIFDVRNRRGRITAEISAIEQQWVLDNIGSGMPQSPEQEGGLHPHSHTHSAPSTLRRLTAHEEFRRRLPEADYEALMDADRREARAAELADKFCALCDSLVDTAADYAVAEDAETGIPLYEKFELTQRRAAETARELAEEWSRVFDSKNFAYGYLLEQTDNEHLIEHGERMFA